MVLQFSIKKVLLKFNSHFLLVVMFYKYINIQPLLVFEVKIKSLLRKTLFYIFPHRFLRLSGKLTGITKNPKSSVRNFLLIAPLKNVF